MVYSSGFMFMVYLSADIQLTFGDTKTEIKCKIKQTVLYILKQ